MLAPFCVTLLLEFMNVVTRNQASYSIGNLKHTCQASQWWRIEAINDHTELFVSMVRFLKDNSHVFFIGWLIS